MPLHRNTVAPRSIHQVDFVSATDPALVADNHVGPHKRWLDTSTTPPTEKIRNAGNTGWTVIAGPDLYASAGDLAALEAWQAAADDALDDHEGRITALEAPGGGSATSTPIANFPLGTGAEAITTDEPVAELWIAGDCDLTTFVIGADAVGDLDCVIAVASYASYPAFTPHGTVSLASARKASDALAAPIQIRGLTCLRVTVTGAATITRAVLALSGAWVSGA